MLAGIMEHAEWILFVLILANQAGIPVFAAPALIAVGALARHGDVNVGTAMVVAVTATLCADLMWYGLGRWRGTWALEVIGRIAGKMGAFVGHMRRFPLAPRVLQFAARFLPELNPVAAAWAGATGIGLGRFARGAIGSAAVWVGTWIGVGYLLGPSRNGQGWISLVAVIIVAALVVVSLVAMLGWPREAQLVVVWPPVRQGSTFHARSDELLTALAVHRERGVMEQLEGMEEEDVSQLDEQSAKARAGTASDPARAGRARHDPRTRSTAPDRFGDRLLRRVA
jgi:membrane protein DedA with SNARE-associated domain